MVLACIAGAYTSVLTATRGGWVAALLYLFFLLTVSPITWRKKIGWVAGVFLVVMVMVSFNQQARTRLNGTQSDLISYSEGEGRDTATGIRLQLWGAALKLFSEHPIFGIGRENYGPSIKAMAERKEVTKELTTLAHSHNEIFFNMAISGIFGLLSTLSLYIVPGYYFVSELRSKSSQVRAAAQAGCIVVIGFFAFGLTDLMFFWTVLCGYYVILISIFLAMIIKAGKQEETGGVVFPPA
nr:MULTISPECIES: O-antigen ligase family protein [unclassified Herbaspirillum]